MERRRHHRSRVVGVGRIGTGAPSLTSCIIRDLTVCGARIMVTDARALPEQVLLVIYPAGSVTWARVVWRGEGLCGVEFLPDQQGSHPEARTELAGASHPPTDV